MVSSQPIQDSSVKCVGLTPCFLTSQQKSFEAGSEFDDLSHITNMKRIIVAISDYLKSEDMPENGINAMADSLKRLGKGLFVTGCVSNKDEDEDEDDVREDSEIWFDYIYEHEEYPE